jgi:hypothetical protein
MRHSLLLVLLFLFLINVCRGLEYLVYVGYPSPGGGGGVCSTSNTSVMTRYCSSPATAAAAINSNSVYDQVALQGRFRSILVSHIVRSVK